MNKLTDVFKLLSDETRLRMLMLLYKEALCGCELEGILAVPQPRISKNLAKMRDMNLVRDSRKEKFIFYSLKKDNAVLVSVLETVSENIDAYPVLKEDRLRMADKEKYAKTCQIN